MHACTLLYMSLHHNNFASSSSHPIALRHITLHYIATKYPALFYMILHCITSTILDINYITSCPITLLCITLLRIIDIHAYIHTAPQVHTLMSKCVHAYVQTDRHEPMVGCMHTYKHIYIHTHTHTNIDTQIHTNGHTYIHAYIHT